MDLLERLSVVVGPALRVERELGGGGMSRVFLAHEPALGRDLVIKVLSAEQSSEIDLARFQREIKVTAVLEHPHILSVLSVGSFDGLLYYTMRYVSGGTLRDLLERERSLSLADAVRLLREVALALAYAHEHGFVHRDIKPENILLSSGTVIVADFGIAKVLAPAHGGSATAGTSTGVGMGTPTYVAPEQVLDASTADARADIYSLGVVAFELSAGRTPFLGRTPTQQVAQRLKDPAPTLKSVRADVPEALSDLVASMLMREPSQRLGSARELIERLDAIASSGEFAAAGRPRRVAASEAVGWYAVGAGGAVLSTVAALRYLNVPDWILPLVGALAILGAPAVLLAFLAQDARGAQPTNSWSSRALSRVQHHLAWGRVARAGLASFGGVILLLAGTSVLRARNVPPALRAQAGARHVIVIANYRATGDDTVWAAAFEGLTRESIARSRHVELLDGSKQLEVLRRMQRDARSPIDEETALDVARRVGAAAVVSGKVQRTAAGHLLTVEAFTADSARRLAQLSATVGPTDELLTVAGRLTRQLRARLGESYRDLRRAPPLPEATTRSTQALALYSKATYVHAHWGDARSAVQFLYDALQLDSTFAEGWRKLAVLLATGARHPVHTAASASKRAYDLREGLPPLERAIVEASYLFYNGLPGSLEAHGRVMTLSDSMEGAINLSNELTFEERWDDAVTVCRASIRRGVRQAGCYSNMFRAQVAAGKFAAAESTLAEFDTVFADDARRRQLWRMELAYAVGGPEARRRLADSLAGRAVDGNALPVLALRSTVALNSGRLREGLRLHAERQAAQRVGPRPPFEPLVDSIELAARDLLLYRNERRGRERLQRLRSAILRPEFLVRQGDGFFDVLSSQFVDTDLHAEQRELLQFFRTRQSPWGPRNTAYVLRHLEADSALLAGDERLAIAWYRQAGPQAGCPSCLPWRVGMAFRRAGLLDSAQHYFEQSVRIRWPNDYLYFGDGRHLTASLETLSEVSEAAGNWPAAERYSALLLDWWRDPDPELQPRVDAVRRRLERARQHR